MRCPVNLIRFLNKLFKYIVNENNKLNFDILQSVSCIQGDTLQNKLKNTVKTETTKDRVRQPVKYKNNQVSIFKTTDNPDIIYQIHFNIKKTHCNKQNN